MKRIAVFFILLLGFISIAFAQLQENRYVVTITYSGESGEILTEKINVLSTSSTEAENKARGQWEAIKQANWTFRFANAERLDEPTQPVSPQAIGYLMITNASPKVQSSREDNYIIEEVYIKTSASSEWNNQNYLGVDLNSGWIRTGSSVTLALGTGIYDIKFVIGLHSYYGAKRHTVESRNIPLREDMVTEMIMNRGNFNISQPRRK